jgi:DNA invertase Pin-like site-specific DNA recombinase
LVGVFVEFETNRRRERQLEGIAKAKLAGIYKGRPASIEVLQVRKLKAGGMGATKIAGRSVLATGLWKIGRVRILPQGTSVANHRGKAPFVACATYFPTA